MQGIKKTCFDWKRWLQESSISVRGKVICGDMNCCLLQFVSWFYMEISESMHPAVSGVAEIVLL